MEMWQEIAWRWLYTFAPLGVLVTDAELVIRGWNRWLEIHTGRPAGEVVGRRLLEVYPELAARGMDRLYRDALAGQAHVLSQRLHRYLLPMTAPDGEDGLMMQSGQIAPLFEEGRVVGTITLIEDVTDRVRAEERLARQADRARRRAERLEAVNRVAWAVSSVLRLDDLMETVSQEVLAILPADAFFIALYDEAAGELDFRVLVDEGIRESPCRCPVGKGLASVVITEGKPLLIRDWEEEKERLPKLQLWGTMKPPSSWLGVPMRIGERTVGVLNVQSYEPEVYGEEEQLLLSTIADQVAVAVENARLFEEEQEQRRRAEALAVENARLYQEVQAYAGQLEQRVAERTAELEAQYARLDAVLRSVSDGIVVTDAQGEIVQVNPLAEAWLERSLPPGEVALLRKVVRDLALRAEEHPREVLELGGFDLELRAAPVQGATEVAAVVAIHDVTDLQALDRMRARFITNISHELRTPVTTVKLYAHLMDRQPERWREFLGPLMQEVEHLERLVEDILEVAHLDAGRQEMTFSTLPLNELTERAVANERERAVERGLTLEYRPAEPGPIVEADPHYMTRALSNLVRNALQYTPEGGRVVLSTGTAEAEGRVWATASVADTGIGIPEEELPHIFDRFFRGERPRAMQVSGTGLGLTIVEQVVALHGGRVTVKSRVGEGSTFTVWLPLAEGR